MAYYEAFILASIGLSFGKYKLPFTPQLVKHNNRINFKSNPFIFYPHEEIYESNIQ